MDWEDSQFEFDLDMALEQWDPLSASWDLDFEDMNNVLGSAPPRKRKAVSKKLCSFCSTRCFNAARRCTRCDFPFIAPNSRRPLTLSQQISRLGAWLSGEASSGRLFEPPPTGAATPVGYADLL